MQINKLKEFVNEFLNGDEESKPLQDSDSEEEAAN